MLAESLDTTRALAYLRPEAVQEHERHFYETTESVSHAGSAAGDGVSQRDPRRLSSRVRLSCVLLGGGALLIALTTDHDHGYVVPNTVPALSRR